MALLNWLNADNWATLRDKINAIVSFCNNLGSQAGVGFVPVGGKVDWWGNPADNTLFDGSGNGIDGTAMQGYAQMLGQALPTGQSLIKNYDGSSRTVAPDMRGKVAAGWSVADSDFAQTGTSGGVKTVTLTKSQIPRHTHNVNIPDSNTGGSSSGLADYDDPDGGGSKSIYNGSATSEDGAASGLGSAGGTVAHTNLQPYTTWIPLIRFK